MSAALTLALPRFGFAAGVAGGPDPRFAAPVLVALVVCRHHAHRHGRTLNRVPSPEFPGGCWRVLRAA